MALPAEPVERIFTTCTLDCPDTCSIVVERVGGGAVRLRGNPDHPLTAGFLCQKVGKYYLDRVYSPERVLHPLIREGEGWRRASWDEALDLVAARLREACEGYGPLSILDYHRAGSHALLKAMTTRFFNILGGVTTTVGSLCVGAVIAGQRADFGHKATHAWEDLANSRFILLWGRNPASSSIHMLPFIKQAREAGAKVVLLEPLGTQTANFCDAHYRLLPGRDAYLAVGMAKVLRREGLVDQEFLDRHAANVEVYLRLLDGYPLPQCAELSGVPVGTIEELARLYGGRHPAAIILGYGINNWRRGAETYRLIDALAALTGNIGVPGGGVSHGHGNNHLETLADPSAHAREFVRHTRTIPQPIIGRGILEASDPPIKVIVVSSANPITQSPNAPLVAKAFRSVDFVVVIDQFLTDTADYAHVFLPTTTFLEEEDVCSSSGHPFFGRVRPAIAPQGEARTDLEIVQGLAERLGFGPLMVGTPKEWLERLLAPVFARGVSREALDQGLAELPDFEDVPFADRRFPTPSGRFELITEFPPDAPTSDGRLYLLSIHPKSWLNSQALPKDQQGLPVASLHPEDGRRFGVADGARARLRSSVGELTVRVKLTEASNPGYVLLYQGGWIKRGHGTNLLTEDRMTDTGLQAAYYETRVDLMPEEATA